ncbi:hypothetical protein [uncultured Bacteroides sp.]|nr:hypothetical protein [uncultured Bacteroides sp.]
MCKPFPEVISSLLIGLTLQTQPLFGKELQGMNRIWAEAIIGF